jgi:hypothetical protein
VQLTRSVKRKTVVGEFGSTGWSLTVTPEEFGYRQPTSQIEVVAMTAYLSYMANHLLMGNLLLEQAILPPEFEWTLAASRTELEKHGETLKAMSLSK